MQGLEHFLDLLLNDRLCRAGRVIVVADLASWVTLGSWGLWIWPVVCRRICRCEQKDVHSFPFQTGPSFGEGVLFFFWSRSHKP